jgi:hypothetical protein
VCGLKSVVVAPAAAQMIVPLLLYLDCTKSPAHTHKTKDRRPSLINFQLAASELKVYRRGSNPGPSLLALLSLKLTCKDDFKAETEAESTLDTPSVGWRPFLSPSQRDKSDLATISVPANARVSWIWFLT